jgi:hypothetical protein
MPRAKSLHMNSPENDETTVCGRQLAKTQWTLQPTQVTCLACKKVMK